MSKHTPGPWKARDYPNNDGGIWVDCDAYANKGRGRVLGGTVCNVYELGDPEQQRANLLLIETAPDLLKLLKEAVELMPLGTAIRAKWMSRAGAAIEKAEKGA